MLSNVLERDYLNRSNFRIQYSTIDPDTPPQSPISGILPQITRLHSTTVPPTVPSVGSIQPPVPIRIPITIDLNFNIS